MLLDTVTGAADAARVAAKVLDAVRAPFRFDDHEVAVAASVWVSVYPGDGTIAEEARMGTATDSEHGLDVGDRVRVELVHTDVERGFIHVARL